MHLPDSGIVRRDAGLQGRCRGAMPGPEIFRIQATLAGKAEIRGMKIDADGVLVPVQHGDGVIATCQRLEQNIHLMSTAYQGGHFTFCILIHCDDGFIAEYFDRLRAEVIEVRAEDQRRGHHGPQGDLAPGFREGHAVVASNDEVGVIPIARLLEAPQWKVIGIIPEHTMEAASIRVFCAEVATSEPSRQSWP